MKCYAVITRFEGQKPTRYFPSDWVMLSFMGQAFKTQLSELEALCDGLEPGKYYYDTLGEMNLYGMKLGQNYWAVACDSPLSAEQQHTLSVNLLIYRMDVKEVANHFDQAVLKAKDPKIALIQSELDETRRTLFDALEKLDTRGEKLSELLAKTENMKQSSFAFRKEAEKLTSCWPCVLL